VGDQNVLTISAEHGLISQEEFFSRRVASENIAGYYRLIAGDFAYNKSYSRGYPMGAIRRLNRYPSGVVSPLYICFRPSASAPVVSDFLAHYFDGGAIDTQLADVAKEGARNHGLLNVSVKEFFEIETALPPVEEQRCVAQILETLDTAIRETEAMIDKLKAVKQGLLHDLLTRGIDANGQLRPTQSDAPQLYKESQLGWIPREWECTTVSAIADVKSGATPSRAMAHLFFAATGINWVKTLDLNEELIYETDERITEQGLRGSSCVEFPAGTVLVAMYGGWEQIGRTGLLAVKAATNQAISALLFRTERILPEFILRAMQHGRPRWQQVAASTRKDPNITKSDVMDFLLPVPSKPEQEMISGRFRSVLEQLQIEQHQCLKLKRKKIGLMDDLLTGRVRVTPLLAPGGGA